MNVNFQNLKDLKDASRSNVNELLQSIFATLDN